MTARCTGADSCHYRFLMHSRPNSTEMSSVHSFQPSFSSRFNSPPLPVGLKSLYEFPSLRSDTQHLVGLLWTSDRPLVENSTCTTHNIHNRYTCPWWDSNPQSLQTRGRRPTPTAIGSFLFLSCTWQQHKWLMLLHRQRKQRNCGTALLRKQEILAISRKSVLIT
jgi:hypothetical protein